MHAAIPLDDMLEKDWQRQVRELAETLGYRRAYHTFDSRRSDVGFPDLVLVSAQRRRVIYLELKREKGRVSDMQAGWIRDLHLAGAEVYVARPRHLQQLAYVLSAVTHTTAAFQEAQGELLLEVGRLIREVA